MVLLMCNLFTLFQFFFNKDTRKLIAINEFCLISSGDMPTLTMATPMQRTFLSWNFTLDLTSVALFSMLSLAVMRVGNFPALFKPGPNNLGIWGIRTWEARKAS